MDGLPVFGSRDAPTTVEHPAVEERREEGKTREGGERRGWRQKSIST